MHIIYLYGLYYDIKYYHKIVSINFDTFNSNDT